jgi:hypothetical protein
MDKFNIVDTNLVYLDALCHGKLGVMGTLVYVKIRVKDREIIAMSDFGATNTFITDRLVTLLGLRLSNNNIIIKAMKEKAQHILGIAFSVFIALEKWQGKHDLLVVTLDDFDIILSLDFLKKAKIVLMSYLERILVTSEICLSFVSYH